MKLYLSSFHLGDEPEKLVSLLSKNAKGLIIVNAKDNLDVSERKKCLQKETQDLESLSLSVEELNLRDYFDETLIIIKSNGGYLIDSLRERSEFFDLRN